MSRFNIHQVETIRNGLDHPECINFGADGRLYAGGFGGQVYVMKPPSWELRKLGQTEGFLLGVAADNDDNVYLCNATEHKIIRMDQKGAVSDFCQKAPDGPVILPNYGAFDANGNYYFSDSGDYWGVNGRLIMARPDGLAITLLANLHCPNGLAIAPRDDSIFIIESTAAAILRIPISKAGSIETPELYAQLQI